MLARLWEHMAARVSGPMSFRLVLQPAMAAFLAVRAGMQDARTGRPPYGWAVLTDGSHRGALMREGWTSIAKVFAAAVAIDVIYQVIVLRWVYPFEALLTAALLACVPYLLLRGLVNRLTRTRPRLERSDPA